MSDFHPCEGWREINVSSEEAAVHAIYQLAEYDEHTGALKRAWVREAPLPPLPTEPYTVIRVEWKDGCSPAEVLTLVGDMWGDYTTGNLGRNITGFEVLAEPTPRVALYQEQQRVARDVLDRIASEPWAREVDLTKWRREFGVSS